MASNNYLLIPVGSSGDVHPIVGVAIALKARGHRVTICANGYFRSLVEKNGLEYVEFGTAEEYLKAINDPDVWHPTRGTKKVMENLIEKLLRGSFDYLRERSKREKFTMISSPLCMGARLVNEKFGVPLISTHLQPLIFRSSHEVPGLPTPFAPSWSPAWWIKFLFWMGDATMIDPIICPPLNKMRAEIGLSPVKRVMKEWWNSPDCIVGLWPDWFGPPQPDWPRNAHLAGFPMYDERTVQALSPELEAFLNAGTPPIAFTPGSAMRQGREFFDAATQACIRLNRRGLLLSRFPENIAPNLPESVRHVDFAPFSLLLPRCAALVHHGGIGTMAQGFAAGIPQLTMPMAHDQPDNTLRLKRLGCGDGLLPAKFRAPAVAEKLGALLDNPDVTRRCAEIRKNFDNANALDRACEIIERHTP